MWLSNVYKHIDFPGWNSNLPSLKKSGGTQPARAKHQTTTVYINDLLFLNNKGYLSCFTIQKNRFTYQYLSSLTSAYEIQYNSLFNYSEINNYLDVSRQRWHLKDNIHQKTDLQTAVQEF